MANDRRVHDDDDDGRQRFREKEQTEPTVLSAETKETAMRRHEASHIIVQVLGLI